MFDCQQTQLVHGNDNIITNRTRLKIMLSDVHPNVHQKFENISTFSSKTEIRMKIHSQITQKELKFERLQTI